MIRSFKIEKIGRWLIFGFCFLALFHNLGKPALWQDEAETALYGRSILQYGYPSVHLGENRITAQPSLMRYESNEKGVWIWNTWIPCYLTALSYWLFGESTGSARLPFAIFGFLAFCLAAALFRRLATSCSNGDRAAFLGLLLLATNVPWLLFMRQCRYYSLACAGTLAAIWGYRMLLRKEWGGAVVLAASLLFLLHSCFFLCPLVLVTLGADVLLRREETILQKRFAAVAGIVALLTLPVAWYFKIWERPGIHTYSFAESLAFLRTFLLWIHQFAFAFPLLLLWIMRKSGQYSQNRALTIGLTCLIYLLILLIMTGEGRWADFGAAAIWAGLAAGATLLPAPKGEIGVERLILLLTVSTLTLFSWSGAEPYGRYLVALIPFFCFAMGVCIAELSDIRHILPAALLSIVLLSSNFLYTLPIRCAVCLRRVPPNESVSGMMRQRLRDVPLRSDIAAFTGELIRDPQGYIEPISDYLSRHARNSDAVFSDADNLSYLFYTGLHFILPQDLESQAPQWILPSPWLRLDTETQNRLKELLKRHSYQHVPIEAPLLLWQNNPDILYHNFHPRIGSHDIFNLNKL